MHSREPKDTVRGWLVVAACSASFFLFVGISCCLGLLELELSRLFGGPSPSLSAINAFYNGLAWGLGKFIHPNFLNIFLLVYFSLPNIRPAICPDSTTYVCSHQLLLLPVAVRVWFTPLLPWFSRSCCFAITSSHNILYRCASRYIDISLE